MASSARRRPNARGAATRETLIDATLHLIGADGIDAVTHRAVAERAGVAGAAVSYHFASKEDLIDAALRTAAEREVERLVALRATLDRRRADPARWAAAVADWLEEQLHGEARLALMAQYHLQLEAARRPELREVLHDWATATHALARDALQRLGAPEPVDAAVLLACAIDGLRLEALSAGDRLTGRRLRGLLERQLRSLAGG